MSKIDKNFTTFDKWSLFVDFALDKLIDVKIFPVFHVQNGQCSFCLKTYESDQFFKYVGPQDGNLLNEIMILLEALNWTQMALAEKPHLDDQHINMDNWRNLPNFALSTFTDAMLYPDYIMKEEEYHFRLLMHENERIYTYTGPDSEDCIAKIIEMLEKMKPKAQ